MTKSDIIKETVEWYSKHPRSKGVPPDKRYTQCAYFFPGDDNKMCAVGRCINPEARDTILETGLNFGDSIELVEHFGSLDKALREEYRGHNRLFWSDLQGFHDTDTFWDQNGLTIEGKAHVEYLTNRYKGSDDKG